MGGNKDAKKGGKGGGHASAKNSTGTLKRNSQLLDAQAETDIMGQEEEVEEEEETFGSAAQAAQARAKATQLVTQEKERSEELARRLKALEEENAALKKVMRCSLPVLVWGISYFLHTICMTASR